MAYIIQYHGGVMLDLKRRANTFLQWIIGPPYITKCASEMKPMNWYWQDGVEFSPSPITQHPHIVHITQSHPVLSFEPHQNK